jgi:hypothetical protein
MYFKFYFYRCVLCNDVNLLSLSGLRLLLLPSFVQDLSAFGSHIPTLTSTVFVSSMKHPLNVTQKEAHRRVFGRGYVLADWRPTSHHGYKSKSFHPSHHHVPSATTRISRILATKQQPPPIAIIHIITRGSNLDFQNK